MTVMGDDIMSDKNEDDISPYLRRPIRSLMEYLREAAQRRRHQGHQEEKTEEGPKPSDGLPSQGGDASKDGD